MSLFSPVSRHLLLAGTSGLNPVRHLLLLQLGIDRRKEGYLGETVEVVEVSDSHY